jgi:hypothetical protein
VVEVPSQMETDKEDGKETYAFFFQDNKHPHIMVEAKSIIAAIRKLQDDHPRIAQLDITVIVKGAK